VKRRRSFRKPSSRRDKRRADWVYRDNAYLDDGSTDDLGSYHEGLYVQNAGQLNHAAVILYDSHNFKRQWVASGNVTNLGYEARAEGRNPQVLRVEGIVVVRPGSWALGNEIRWGWRLLRAEQDPRTGAVLLDNNYSMYAHTASLAPSQTANSTNLLKEWRFFKGFNASESSMHAVSLRWRGRITLRGGDECLCLYTEGAGAPAASVNCNFQYWFRSLIRDES